MTALECVLDLHTSKPCWHKHNHNYNDKDFQLISKHVILVQNNVLTKHKHIKTNAYASVPAVTNST